MTRTTGTAANMTAGCTVNCGNANKNWVDAFIQITPQNATNAVGTNHVLTITVTATGGGSSRPDGDGEHRHAAEHDRQLRRLAHLQLHGRGGDGDLHGHDHLGGRRDDPGAGDLDVHRRSRQRSRATTGTAANTAAGGDCGNATKNWVDAFIQITPPNATNAVGTNHVLTITVNAPTAASRARAAHGDGVDRAAGRPAASSARPLQLHGRRGDRDLHGHDHLGGRGDDGGVGDLGHPGERPDDHAHDQHGGEHGGRRERQREQDVGEGGLADDDLVEPDGRAHRRWSVGDGHGDGHGRRGTAGTDGDGDILPVPADEVTANGGDCSANGTQVGTTKTLSASGVATSSGTADPSNPTTAAGSTAGGRSTRGTASTTRPATPTAARECFVVVPDCNIYYPYDTVVNPLTSTDFNENEVLREFEPAEIAVLNDTVRLFYNDEHTLSLGVSQVSVKTSGGTTVTTCAISPFPASNPPCTPVPGVNGGFACHVADPQVGTTGVPSNPTNDATCTQNNVDPSGRPVYPALFITDLTLNGWNACSKPWADAGPPGRKVLRGLAVGREGRHTGRRVRDVEGRDRARGQDEGSDDGDIHGGCGYEEEQLHAGSGQRSGAGRAEE